MINVLVVDDSQVVRDLLTYIIETDSQLKVIGHAENGKKALEFLQHHKPDVITMDILMPLLDGFEVTRTIMQTKPIPIIIISGLYASENVEQSFKAIEAGALAILEKPMGIGDIQYRQKAAMIIKMIKIVSEIKLVTRTRSTQYPAHSMGNSTETIPSRLKTTNQSCAIKAVAIGASLGGPPALSTILSSLPSSFPVPIFLVQHIAEGFSLGFVKWLNERSSLKVQLAQNGEKGRPGCVYVACDNMHMKVSEGGIIVLESEPSEGIRPSVGQLFSSMAETYGPSAVGVILTGMGKDGAEELFLMKQKGAVTIAQNKESCVIFGMPYEAIKRGAVTEVLSLERIAPTLENLVKW